MSGHSKWATTKRKKAIIDSKRGKIFTKIVKEITISARIGGGDPSDNPRLRLAIDNAKSVNMPADNIERAIKKATGELQGVVYSELTYEGYAPSGIAVMVEVATDNKNRTVAEVRHFFSKYNGSMGESGSVAFLFERKGVISLTRENQTEDELTELVLDAGADDLITGEDYFEVFTTVHSFEPVRKLLIEKGFTVDNASLQWVSKSKIKVTGEDAEKVMKLIDMIEDNEDVQAVYHNAEFED